MHDQTRYYGIVPDTNSGFDHPLSTSYYRSSTTLTIMPLIGVVGSGTFLIFLDASVHRQFKADFPVNFDCLYSRWGILN